MSGNCGELGFLKYYVKTWLCVEGYQENFITPPPPRLQLVLGVFVLLQVIMVINHSSIPPCVVRSASRRVCRPMEAGLDLTVRGRVLVRVWKDGQCPVLHESDEIRASDDSQCNFSETVQ